MNLQSFRLTFFSVIMLIVVADHAQAVDDNPQMSVGTSKQLFVDDFVIEKTVGLKRVLHQPSRYANNPIMIPEHPWEGRVLEMPIVVWDDELRLFHMHYWAVHSEAIYACYARSHDGLDWEKPILNLHVGPDCSKHTTSCCVEQATKPDCAM